MRIFINERPVEAAEGSNVLTAIRGFDPQLAAAIDSGAGYVTDARAIPLQGDEPVGPGDILRVILRGPKARGAVDADA